MDVVMHHTFRSYTDFCRARRQKIRKTKGNKMKKKVLKFKAQVGPFSKFTGVGEYKGKKQLVRYINLVVDPKSEDFKRIKAAVEELAQDAHSCADRECDNPLIKKVPEFYVDKNEVRHENWHAGMAMFKIKDYPTNIDGSPKPVSKIVDAKLTPIPEAVAKSIGQQSIIIVEAQFKPYEGKFGTGVSGTLYNAQLLKLEKDSVFEQVEDGFSLDDINVADFGGAVTITGGVDDNPSPEEDGPDASDGLFF